MDQSAYFDVLVKDVTAFETFVHEFYDEVDVHLLGAEFLYEIACRLHRSACCEEVVVKEYHIVCCDGVLVNLNGVGSILLFVTLLYGFCWQLSWLSAEYYACAEADGKC